MAVCSETYMTVCDENQQLRQQLEAANTRIESQHEQILEIHRATSAVAEVKIEPADYSETLTVRRVKEMARLMNLMSGWIDEYKGRAEQAEARAEACQQQAQIWKQEARTQGATVAEIYQELTGKAGEPGDWNGAKPVKAAVLRKQADAVEKSKYERALVAKVPALDSGHYFTQGFDACEEQYDDAIDRYAQRLLARADELEKGGRDV